MSIDYSRERRYTQMSVYAEFEKFDFISSASTTQNIYFACMQHEGRYMLYKTKGINIGVPEGVDF